MIQFVSNKVIIDGYMLRHYHYPGYYIRNWKIEGSNNYLSLEFDWFSYKITQLTKILTNKLLTEFKHFLFFVFIDSKF
jgi:hypothetical protein